MTPYNSHHDPTPIELNISLNKRYSTIIEHRWCSKQIVTENQKFIFPQKDYYINCSTHGK